MKRIMVLLVILVVIGCAQQKPIGQLQPGMTKQDVLTAWGDTPIKSFFTNENGKVIEVWQYNQNKPAYQLGYGMYIKEDRAFVLFDGDRIVGTYFNEAPPMVRVKVK